MIVKIGQSGKMLEMIETKVVYGVQIINVPFAVIWSTITLLTTTIGVKKNYKTLSTNVCEGKFS